MEKLTSFIYLKSAKLQLEQLNAEYVTPFYMRGAREEIKYIIFHATNHRRGRELIKDTMWRVAPTGNFTARERDNPDQQVLLREQPDLRPFEQNMMHKFRGRTVQLSDVYDWLDDTLYLRTHLHSILRNNRDSGTIEFSGYEGRFAFNKNPTLSFTSEI